MRVASSDGPDPYRQTEAGSYDIRQSIIWLSSSSIKPHQLDDVDFVMALVRVTPGYQLRVADYTLFYYNIPHMNIRTITTQATAFQ
jgi:hypothetical protein